MENTQKRQENLVSEFVITDVNGVAHKAILAGVLQVEKSTENRAKKSVMHKKDSVVTTFTHWTEKVVYKSFSMGLAITNPTDDTYDLAYGTRRALGRAVKPSKMLGQVASNGSSMLGREMCQAIMNQQISFIQNNQALFLKVTPAILPVGVTA